MNSGPWSKRIDRCAPFGDQALEAGHHAIGDDGALDVDGQGFTAVFVDDVEQLEHPFVGWSNWKSRAHTTLV